MPQRVRPCPPSASVGVLTPEMLLDDALTRMARAGVRQAPVFDGRCVRGVLSRQEIARFRSCAPHRTGGRVADAMTRRFDVGYDLGHRPPLVVERPR